MTTASNLPGGSSTRTLLATPAEAGRRVPGQPDMWALVLFEGMFFTAYFTVYMICRVMDPEAFLASQAKLDLHWGFLNTLVMLTSSWFIARCVQSTREADYSLAMKNVVITFACGLVFVVLKVSEWSSEITQGLTFTFNEFFSFYYFLTGIHFIHLLVGFVVLGVVIYQLRSPERRSQEIIETGATYWHLVDFLWVIIFALLYMIR
jgi:nitric oxide reductase NorE protein